jgi:DNA-binding MarR family transcriptional regulator
MLALAPARSYSCCIASKQSAFRQREVLYKMADFDESELPPRLRVAVGRLSRRLRRTHAGTELTVTELGVLATLTRHGPLGMSRLAEEEGLNPTMLSRVAQRLEGAGLLIRRPHPTDGRAASVEVSPQGRRLTEQIRTEKTSRLRLLVDGLSDGERAALAAALPVLERLADELKNAASRSERA